MASRIAFLFPGQGAYMPGALRGYPEAYPEISSILSDIDGVCGEYGHRPVSGLLLDRAAPSIEELLAGSPESLHLAIFTVSVAVAAACAAEGTRADVLVGHSFGEWAALTVAGVWSPAAAARLICERDRVCRQTVRRPGGLLAVSLGARQAGYLAAAVDDWALSVAVVNGPGQCVLAGPDAELRAAAGTARALGATATRVKAAYPYHSPWMRDAAEAFGLCMERADAGTPRARVYSPIAREYVETAAQIRLIGSGHLVRPVDFFAALMDLQADGVNAFVECGAKAIVSRLASQVLVTAATAAPLDRLREPREFRSALEALGGTAPAPLPVTRGRALPEPCPPSDEPSAAPAPEAEPVSAPTIPGPPPLPALIAELRALYAGQLGYPPDVVTEDAQLEADLGVDSLRQIQMLATVRARYGLPVPEEPDLGRHRTVAEIAESVLTAATAAEPG